MTLEEYIAHAKEELDEMKAYYMRNREKDPEMWPLDREESDWREDELLTRF